jgi:hypothetical protein
MAAIGLMQAAVCLTAESPSAFPGQPAPALAALIPTVALMTGMGLLFGNPPDRQQSGGIFPILINAATLMSAPGLT